MDTTGIYGVRPFGGFAACARRPSDGRQTYRAIRELRSSGPCSLSPTVLASDVSAVSEGDGMKPWIEYFERLYPEESPPHDKY